MLYLNFNPRGIQMSGFMENCLQNQTTRRMANPIWRKHVQDHFTYLMERAALTKVPDYLFATYRHRPVACLQHMEVPFEHVYTVMILNRISMVDGLREEHHQLYIPSEDALERLDESF
jgi:hypothetical protein